jgi:hypothetical protein
MPKKQPSNNNQLFNNKGKNGINYIRKNKIDLIFILLIAIFTLGLVYWLININNQLGIYCSDVFIYLLNSLNFAGYSIGTSSTMYLSPVICFLTSLIFRLGVIDQTVIFAITGIFFPIASIGLYLLCRLHLNKLISLFGTFLFISFSLNILWTANGSLDIPAIAISIWVMYFLILATDKNPKYFTIAFPLFIIGFFTRYTVGFILPLMILYILFKIDFLDKIRLIFDKKLFIRYIKNLIKFKSLKYLIIGIIIAILVLIVLLKGLLIFGADLTFITQTQDVISGGKGSSIDPGFKVDPLFYLTNLPNFISSTKITFDGPIPVLQNHSILSYFILSLIIVGFLVYISKIFIKFIKNRNIVDKNEGKDDNIDLRRIIDKDREKSVNNGIDESKKYLQKFNKLSSMIHMKIVGVVILSTILIATYSEISSIISEILFLINILLVFNILNKYSIKDLNFNLLMFSWFMVYLIFFSFTNIKVDRYFITVMPVIPYFAAYFLNFLINEINKINFIKNNLLINLNNLFKLFKQNKQNTEDNCANKKIIANEEIKEKKIVEINNKINNNDNNNFQVSILGLIIPVLFIIIFIMSSFSHVETIPTKNNIIQDPIKASKWLMKYDPDYDSKVIWTHNRRYYTWYLKKNVVGAYEKDLHKLEKNNVSYLIFNNSHVIENYTLIKGYDSVYIYERNL